MTQEQIQTQAPLVELKNISKSFGGVHAVRDVSVDLFPGEVVGLLGHNGAGKSTLIKILSGAYTADEGEIWVGGQRAHIRTPKDAKTYGVETIYQALALADNLNASANIFLGRELTGPLGATDDDAMESETRGLLKRLGLTIKSLHDPVRNLSGGQRQAIAIGRAVYFNAKVLIMDEPTAALGPQETQKVASLIQQLKGEGLGIFLVSHDLTGVFGLADRVSVMHNGRLVGTRRVADTDQDEVLRMIIRGQARPVPVGQGV